MNLAKDLLAIPVASYLLALCLAGIGGCVYTAQKLNDPAIDVSSMVGALIKDLTAAILAGLLTFLICSAFEVRSLLQAFLIALNGYGGSRILEKYLNGVFLSIDKLGGK